MTSNFYFQQMQTMVKPMRDELTSIGFKELTSSLEVETAMADEASKGTCLIVINSVCGCAAGCARPGVALSLDNTLRPDHLYTVFAGQDKEATAKVREYLIGQPPSSPSFAFLKDGNLVEMITREQIENVSMEDIAANLKRIYDQNCAS